MPNCKEKKKLKKSLNIIPANEDIKIIINTSVCQANRVWSKVC